VPRFSDLKDITGLDQGRERLFRLLTHGLKPAFLLRA
jgi:hypothetical protein